MRSQPQRNRKGYSIIEMIIATVLVISVTGVSYRVLRTITMRQAANVAGQKSNKAADAALDRFKKDMSMVDFNWVRYGVASIYPQPGYGFGTNYYIDFQIRNVEALSDGVTFLRRDPASDKVYPILSSKKLCYPSGQSAIEDDLYFNGILLKDGTAGLAVKDWVLVYQPGKYALAIIAGVNANGIVLKKPVQRSLQVIDFNNSQITPAPGVVAANMDFTGTSTPSVQDDSFCFDLGGVARVQKIANPVSYFIDYRTTDGEPKSALNSYVLNKNGNREKMLVRQEYDPVSTIREYIASVDQVEITYDLLTDDDTVQGKIIRGVGHQLDLPMLQLLSNLDPTNNDMLYETSNKIVAVNMNLRFAAQDRKDIANSDLKLEQDIKVAIDPSLQVEMYQDKMDVFSDVTKNLNTIPKQKYGSTFNEQVGKPAYYGGVPGSEEVLVPVNTFEIDQNGNMGIASVGAIYVYDANTDPQKQAEVGCPVNHTGNSNNCAPNGPVSTIEINPASGATFFPSAITQMTLSDGTTKFLIGGVGINVVNNVATRSPVLATIDVPPGATLAQMLNNQQSGACNIPNCMVQEIDNTQTGMGELVDTANVSFDRNSGNIFVATMTKTVNDSSNSAVYAGVPNGSGYTYTKVGDVDGTTNGRIVSAIGDKVIYAGGNGYLPVCTTKKLNCTDGGGNPIDCLDNSNGAVPGVIDPNNDPFGRISLIRDDGVQIMLMRHNWKCSSLTIDGDNNIFVGGRLTAQMIKMTDLRAAVMNQAALAEMQKKVLYLDEIGEVSNGTPYFADYYQIDPTTFVPDGNNVVHPQDIGWFGGISMFETLTGSFLAVNANKYRLEPGAHSAYTTNSSNQVREYSNVGIANLNYGGMRDRVVATIETNSSNLNASAITAVYNQAVIEIPESVFPGTFYANPVTGVNRTTPTPLPATLSTMTEVGWLDLYRQMVTATGKNLNQDMPTIGATMNAYNCKLSSPRCAH